MTRKEHLLKLIPDIEYDLRLEKLNLILEAMENHTEEQLRLIDVSNSCGVGDISILIKGLEDISKWDDEQEEWYDDPGHCANMTLIKYYNSKK